MIIDDVNLNDVVKFLLEISNKILCKSNFESEDRLIVQNSLAIVLAVCYFDPEKLMFLLEYKTETTDFTRFF